MRGVIRTSGAVGAAWLVSFVSAMALASPGDGAAGWVGTWRGDAMVVTLAAKGDAVTGTLQRGAQSFPLTAAVTPDGLAGTFESQGYRYPFTLTRTGSGATLTTGGARYALSRVPGQAPGAAGKTPTRPVTPAGWKPYKHALGYTVDLPGGWTVQPVDADTLALVPDDLQRGPDGPEEVLLLAGLPAEGITDPADPRVAAALDGHVRALFPGLSREGAIEPARLGPHRASVLRWAGKAPTGIPLRASVVTRIHQGTVVALLIAARPERTSSREKTARRILATLRLGRPVIDPRLVGFWRREKSFFAGDFSSTRIDEMALKTDGTFTFRSQLLGSTKERTPGGPHTGTSHGESRGDVQRGRWSAATTPRRRLRLVWSDGTEARYAVELSGKSLLLIGDGGEKLLYERVD